MNFKLALFKRLLPCLLSLTSFSVSAQKKERAHIDSLLKQLPAAREDTNKANLLRRLGDGYLNRLKTDSALLYYQQEGYLSQKIHWKKGVALANISVGCCYIYIKKDFAGAQNYLDKALRLSFEIKDYRAAYYAARYIAAAMVFQNRAPENIKFLVSFAARLKEANQTGFLADTYFLIGDYSKYFSSYSDAMDYYDRALKLEETAHRQYLKSPDILSIASFYADLHHLDKAKTFLQRAVAMDENAHNLPALVDDYSGLAHYADAAHDEAAVMAYDNKALQMAQKANNRYMLCSIENEISWRYFLKKDYDRAFIHARNAISYGTVGSSALAYAYGTMGCIYRTPLSQRRL
jgi:tetratricopeptide (TPR) repeat protein